MRRLTISATLATLLLLTLAVTDKASAQVTVIGEGLAKTCFEAAMSSRSYNREGEEACDRALAGIAMTHRDRAATHVNRAILRMRDGRFDAADSDLSRAVSLAPDIADINLNIGALRLYQDRPAEAIPLLTAAIEAGSARPAAAYYNRAVAYERIGDVSAAYWDYVQASSLSPDWELAALQVGRFTVETRTE